MMVPVGRRGVLADRVAPACRGVPAGLGVPAGARIPPVTWVAPSPRVPPCADVPDGTTPRARGPASGFTIAPARRPAVPGRGSFRGYRVQVPRVRIRPARGCGARRAGLAGGAVRGPAPQRGPNALRVV